jgi:Leucine-rich repeat (LRR) protein
LSAAALEAAAAAARVLARRLKAAAATGVLSLRGEPVFAAALPPADPLAGAGPNASGRGRLEPWEALRMVAAALTSPPGAARLRVLCLAGTGLGDLPRPLPHAGKPRRRLPFAGLGLELGQPWASLQGLRCLDLAHNGLTALPRAVAALVSLQRLSLSHNRLGDGEADGAASGLGADEEVNEEGGSGGGGGGCLPALPPALQQLALAGNGLRRAPAAVAALAGLREVNLDLNRLRSLPEVGVAIV